MDHQALIQVSDAIGGFGSDSGHAAPSVPASNVTTTELSAVRGPVFIIDDDDWVCDSLSVLLEAYGFTVAAYPSAAAFLEDGHRDRAKCLIVDQHMPGMDGLDLIGVLRTLGPSVPAILITGRVDAGIKERADLLGVLGVLEKPFAVSRLVELIDSAVAPS